MKIKPEHYEHIRAALLKAPSTFPTVSEYEALGFTEKRWQWELAHAVGLTPYFCSTIYPYANDDHIQTALTKALDSICAAAKEQFMWYGGKVDETTVREIVRLKRKRGVQL
jgi:hypothetical protein